MYLNGQYSWYDGHSNSNPPTVVVELDERRGLKEQLRYDEICTRVHLLPEMLNILVVVGAVRVTAGITWNYRDKPVYQTGLTRLT